MIHALFLTLLPLFAQGSLTTTVIGDAAGIGSISETDNMGLGRSYWIEPQTRSFIRVEASEHGRRVVAGETVGPWFKVIARMVFSPDGTRHAYIGRSLEGESIVVDGELIVQLERGGSRLVHLPPPEPYLGGETAGTSGGQLMFSPDGRHIAWVLALRAPEGPGYQIVLDFEPVATVERLGFLTFTPDGQLVWSTCSGFGPGSLVVAGAAGPEFETIDRLIFAAGSSSWAYRGIPAGGGPARLLVDHEVVVDLGEPPYAGRTIAPSGVAFAPDLDRVAVLLEPGEDGEPETGALDLLVNGEHVGKVRPGTPVAFAPDGRLFYQRPDGTTVLGGQAGPRLEQVQQVAFAPTGDRHVYMTSAGSGMSVEGRDSHSGPWARVTGLALSPDGAHSVFISADSGKTISTLHLDGSMLLWDMVRVAETSFSADGSVLFVTAEGPSDEAWAEATERARELGVKLVRRSASRREAVSPDGNTRASCERVELPDDKTAFELHINGEATGERFEQYPAAFSFDADGVLRFISRRGTDVLRCEYKP